MDIIKILGKDICFYLLQFVDTKDISSLAKVNKFFNTLIKRKYSHVTTWKKVKKEIGKGDYYSLILAQKYREFSLNDCLYAACRGGSLTLVKEMLKRGADDTFYGFRKACRGGHKEIFDFIIKKEDLCKNPDRDCWNYAIKGACIGGHENIVKNIIELCGYSLNYSYLIEGAFIGNDIQLLKYIPGDTPYKDWDKALFGAAYNNSFSLMKYVLKKGVTNMQYALNGACHGDNLNFIKNLINDYSYKWDWGQALFYACMGGSKKISDYILNNHKCSVNYGLSGACYGGKLEIIEYVISKGAKSWKNAFFHACEGRRFHIVKMICEEKIKYLNKEYIEKFIYPFIENKEIKKYLKSILKKMEN